VIDYGLGVTLWLTSLALDEGVRPVVWGAAMLLLIGVPLAVFLQPQRAYDTGHIAERYGLFTIIMLDESVVVTVDGLHIVGSVGAVVVTLFVFMIAATVWWVYFGRYRSMPADGVLARFVWARTHLLRRSEAGR
jgi:low temperature requirement protein LtrA